MSAGGSAQAKVVQVQLLPRVDFQFAKIPKIFAPRAPVRERARARARGKETCGGGGGRGSGARRCDDIRNDDDIRNTGSRRLVVGPWEYI